MMGNDQRFTINVLANMYMGCFVALGFGVCIGYIILGLNIANQLIIYGH